MNIKTPELIGPALDWAVATILWPPAECSTKLNRDKRNVTTDIRVDHGGAVAEIVIETREDGDPLGARMWKPSTNWAQGGPLIDSYKVELRSGLAADNKTLCRSATVWVDIGESAKFGHCLGGTNLIAAMRAIVAAKLGDEVDVPVELVQL